MKNIDKWRLYTKTLPSPNSFIDWGFYAMVAAALQRRVWVGPPNRPLHPNMYTIFCGKPGVGKSLVIKDVYSMLSFFKKQEPIRSAGTVRRDQEETDKQQRTAKEYNGFNVDANKASAIKRDKLLIPIAADTTTVEALVNSLANSYDAFMYKTPDGIWKPYTHCSLAFCLEELSTLINEKDDRIPKLLLKTYDCGDYTKETKNNGSDYVKKCCLNFIAGTTPSFMQEILGDKILNDGFSSRAFFIFEYTNRFSCWKFAEPDTDQKVAEQELKLHILELTKLYGQCTYTPEAEAIIDEWCSNFPIVPRPNSSLKLESYYSRKGIHIQKLATACHFAENTSDYLITGPEVMQAISMLDKAEKNMHYALSYGERNPLATGARKVLAYMGTAQKDVTFTELLIEFYEDFREEELKEVMQFLYGTGKVKFEKMGDSTLYSKIKE
jgi:hypothetical protein